MTQNQSPPAQNQELVMKLGKNSTFYDFPINLLEVREKNLKHFGPQSSDLDMGQIYPLDL